MAVLLNRKTFESALPHMPMTPVVLVVSPNVTCHPPLHEGAQRRFGGLLHDQMKMIRHEADAQYLDRVFRFRRGKQVKEGSAVAIFVKDGRTTVPT